MFSAQTILHATDFSPCSDLAFELAASLARDCGARLIVLHVAPPPVLHLEAPIYAPPLPREWGREGLEQELQRRATPGLEGRLQHRLEYADSASAAILRVASEMGCDLIVLGTHGRTGLSRLLMGSVAEHVLREAKCPVLTVRHLAAG